MEGIININGVIGEDVELVDVISQVRKQKEATSFVVYIDSQGGRVDTGFDILNYLKSLGLPIKTVGRGVVASIATVIFMAGSRREVLTGTTFMIHYPMITHLEYATSEVLDDTSKELKKIEQKVKMFYSENTGLDQDTIATMLKNETFMSEDQLFDLGFTTSKEPAKIAAVLTLKDKDMSKKNEKEVGNKILNLITNFLKGEDVVAKTLFDAEQNEVVFPDLEENEEITVGANATVGGDPATGSIVMADGRTFVFEAGELTEIIEEVPAEDVEALKARILELEAKETELQAQLTTQTESAAELKTEKDNALEVINKIKGIQSQLVMDEPKEKKEPIKEKKEVRSLSAAVAKLKKA